MPRSTVSINSADYKSQTNRPSSSSCCRRTATLAREQQQFDTGGAGLWWLEIGGNMLYVSDCSARDPCRVSHGGRELVSRTFRHRNLGCLRWSHTSSLVPLSLRLDYVLAAELSASPCTSSAGGTEDQCLGGYSRGYPHPVRVSPNLICAPLKNDFEYHLVW